MTSDQNPGSRWLPREGEEGPTIWAVLPWLGVPVLLSALMARLGRPIPGEILPVVAFLPVVALAYLAAVSLPPSRRVAIVGSSGWLVLAALLAFLGRRADEGAVLTFLVAVLAAVIVTAAVFLVARTRPSVSRLMIASGLAMVLTQGLDGFQTYLAVDNPFGWLPRASSERVLVSRVVLETAPALYPVLKVALAVGVTYMLGRRAMPAVHFVPLVLLVCYTGLSPAMFSVANLFVP